MNAHSPIAETEDPAAWAQGMLRRQVERLDALAELGLEMAQAIAAEKADGTVTAFSRVAKVVRMCGLLQSKLIQHMEDASRRQAIHAPLAEEQARLAKARERAALDPANDHKARVERIVERQARARHPRDEDEVERLMLEACERLDDDDIYRDVQSRPIGELVARLCQDLGLDPDWQRLSQEAWAQDEIERGQWPFPRPPPFAAANGGGGPSAERSEEPMVVGENHRTTPAGNGARWQSHADPDHYP